MLEENLLLLAGTFFQAYADNIRVHQPLEQLICILWHRKQKRQESKPCNLHTSGEGTVMMIDRLCSGNGTNFSVIIFSRKPVQ